MNEIEDTLNEDDGRTRVELSQRCSDRMSQTSARSILRVVATTLRSAFAVNS